MKNSFQIDNDLLTQILTVALNESEPQTVESVQCLGPTYVALRQKGLLLAQYWLKEEELFNALRNNITPAIFQDEFKGVDTIELCLTRQFRPVPIQEFEVLFLNIKRGIRGIKLQYQGYENLWSPTQMLAHNYSFEQVFENFLKNLSISELDFLENGGEIQVFEAKQVLVSLKPQIKVTMMYRGNQIVPLEEMSSQTISDMAQNMGSWLLDNCDIEGRLSYRHLPSKDKTSKDQDITTELITSLCLIRYAKFTEEAFHLAIADRNLNYNLGQLLWRKSEMEHQEKLNAAAVAALAILEHPWGDRYQEIFQMLYKEIEALWKPDGCLGICYKPSDPKVSQNYEPGLMLLFWASLYKMDHDEELFKRCCKSLFFYWAWPKSHPHPAYIHWHSQAYTILFEETGDPVLLDLIFQMNDWLVSIQQWDCLRELDARGRFYTPEYQKQGLLSAAGTGSCLQSLVDAYRLALQVEDTARAATYQLAIWRGLRSLCQLQFKDDVDMFYIHNREKVKGALRTKVYDNTIRLDNLHQSLFAILKLFRLPAFPKRPPQPRLAFRLIKQAVDISSLLAEIESKSYLWGFDTSRQTKLAVQQETENIFLRRAAKPFPPGIDNAKDVHASCFTEIASEFPVVMGLVEKFVQEIGGELGRVNIVRLAPKGRVYPHIDHGEYYLVRDRYHLVLHSSSGSWMKAGNEEVVMHEGELWWFDNKQTHESFNPSDEWRMHLIFDILPLKLPNPIEDLSSINLLSVSV